GAYLGAPARPRSNSAGHTVYHGVVTVRMTLDLRVVAFARRVGQAVDPLGRGAASTVTHRVPDEARDHVTEDEVRPRPRRRRAELTLQLVGRFVQPRLLGGAEEGER